jgi:hypothetical protein
MSLSEWSPTGVRHARISMMRSYRSALLAVNYIGGTLQADDHRWCNEHPLRGMYGYQY